MIKYCPECGHHLPHELTNGITSCQNCRRVFDSSHHNRILSAAWAVRRRHIEDPYFLSSFCGLEFSEAEMLVQVVGVQCFNHDEFSRFLNSYRNNVA